MMDDFADYQKSKGGLKPGDKILIPAGTFFSVPVYQGRWEYTFDEDVEVEIQAVDYHNYRLWHVEKLPALYLLPKYTNEPGHIVPDWRKFRIEPDANVGSFGQVDDIPF